MRDVAVHSPVGYRKIIHPPNVIQKFIPRNDLSLVRDQKLEDSELERGQIQTLSCLSRFVFGEVQLHIPETDRACFALIVLDAPEKSPRVFERLLPYAIALNLTSIWTRQFADLMQEPPQWYAGRGTTFHPHLFTLSMIHLTSGMERTFASAPRSAGGGRSAWGGGSSFGGGFSGGGFGGGGGGGW